MTQPADDRAALGAPAQPVSAEGAAQLNAPAEPPKKTRVKVIVDDDTVFDLTYDPDAVGIDIDVATAFHDLAPAAPDQTTFANDFGFALGDALARGGLKPMGGRKRGSLKPMGGRKGGHLRPMGG